MINLTAKPIHSRQDSTGTPKLGEYIPHNGEQGNTGTGNKKGEYMGNSRVFGKMGNFPAKSGNPVPGEYATKGLPTKVPNGVWQTGSLFILV